MKTLALSAAAVLAAVHSAGAIDLSVNTLTDFVSDVKASIALRDKDGDGMLSKEELGDRAWMLLALDQDHDGRLSEEELKRGVGKLSRTLFPSRSYAPSTELAPMLEIPAETARGPKLIRGADCQIGRLMPDAALATLDGQTVHLSDYAGEKGMVLAMISTSCPVSKKYLPALARMEKEYAARGIKFAALAAPGEDDSAALKTTGLTAPVLRDASGGLLRALGATHTTDVFVLDAARTLVYRGAVDDQYGLGYNRDESHEHFLAAALESMLIDQRPFIAATKAPGCELELPPVPNPVPGPGPGVTWHNRISRIVQTHCVACHRAEGVAPFPFESYAQFLKKAGTVKRVVNENVMPPWFIPATAGAAHTPWLNDASLPAADKADLLAWLAGDRPEGDPKDAARPLSWPDGWTIGKPDFTLQIPQPIAVKAEGTMPYQSIMVETKLTEDKWVTAWEVRPTARNVVHHILVYIYNPAKPGFPGTEERRGHLADYTPGFAAAVYPEGFAKFLPRGATLRFEIHYTPNGKATQDQTTVGLKFAAKPPEHVVEIAGIANVQLAIPPGEPAHPEAAVMALPGNARLLSFTPHMHKRGKAMRFEAISPTGETRTLLDLPRYDFNWQIPARYADPPLIPTGSLIRVTGWFDNSSGNPANPNPQATVHWGSQTDDEMMIGYVEYYREK